MFVIFSSNIAVNVLANEFVVQRQCARLALLRFNLLFGCVTVVVMVVWLGVSVLTIADDLELARLLCGMAAIKAAIVVVIVAVLHWRFGRALLVWLVSLYLVGVWLIIGVSMMIWQLAQIPIAAFFFHLGAFVLLVTVWRDRAS